MHNAHIVLARLEQTGKADGGLVPFQWQWGLKNEMNWLHFWDVGNFPAILDRPHRCFVPLFL